MHLLFYITIVGYHIRHLLYSNKQALNPSDVDQKNPTYLAPVFTD